MHVRRILAFVFFAGLALSLARGAAAQSPTPSWFMEDSRPGNSYPSGANAVVVEGLQVGVGGCAFSLSSTEQQTVHWINQGLQVVTEISTYEPCAGSASAAIHDYEVAAANLIAYVEGYASNPGRYWGGIMFDEESGWGLNPGNIEAINQYTENAMVNTPGLSWMFTEDFTAPGYWTLAQYNAVVDLTWPAPQAYNSFEVGSIINPECSTYGNCTNDVTVDSAGGYPWNSPSWVTGQVHGTPWSASAWGSGNWYNLWRSQ